MRRLDGIFSALTSVMQIVNPLITVLRHSIWIAIVRDLRLPNSNPLKSGRGIGNNLHLAH